MKHTPNPLPFKGRGSKDQTPRQLGYRMPAEWEAHTATWLAWPHNLETWPLCMLQKVEESFAMMAAALSVGERVEILIHSSEGQKRASTRIQEQPCNFHNIRFHPIPTIDAWIRDYGPNFIVKENSIAVNNWRFNAWGEKYEMLIKDDQIPLLIKPLLKMPYFEPGIVLEGGSIEVNGKGACITTKQCLLNKNRNPELTQLEIETYLKNHLGLRHIIWLNKGIVGDDTDGHIDDIARFIDPTTVLIVEEENFDDPNFAPLQENLKILKNSFDQDGSPLKVMTLPMPKPCVIDGEPTPASYANFYIANSVILVPTYDEEKDLIVLDLLKQYFPERKILGIPSKNLVYGLGSIHCVTQQQPKI